MEVINASNTGMCGRRRRQRGWGTTSLLMEVEGEPGVCRARTPRRPRTRRILFCGEEGGGTLQQDAFRARPSPHTAPTATWGAASSATTPKRKREPPSGTRVATVTDRVCVCVCFFSLRSGTYSCIGGGGGGADGGYHAMGAVFRNVSEPAPP